MSDSIETIKAIGAIVTPIILSYITYLGIKLGKKQDIMHKQMNGMKTELVEAVKVEYEAIGNKKGKSEQRAEGQETADKVVTTIKADPGIEITKSKKNKP